MAQYPKDLTVVIDDFRRSNWKAAITSGERNGYRGMLQALASAADSAFKEGKISEGKVLRLLADACSLTLVPRSPNDPFKPIFNGAPSSDDFEPADVDLFSQIAKEVEEPWLQARLADLSWVLKRPPNYSHALLAIDAYRKIPLDAKTWENDGKECWERAIRLALMLKGGAGNRLQEIEMALLSVIEGGQDETGFLTFHIAELLLVEHLARSKAADVAKMLEALARRFDVNGKISAAGEFFTASAKWFQLSGNVDKATEMIVSVAEGWIKEAEGRILADPAGHMAAMIFYERAIQTYRLIPNTQRTAYVERIAEIHKRLGESGQLSLAGMRKVNAPALTSSI